MLLAQVHLTLPVWVHDAVDTSRTYASDADKVALAIALSRGNVAHGSGGPFGAQCGRHRGAQLAGCRVKPGRVHTAAHARAVDFDHVY